MKTIKTIHDLPKILLHDLTILVLALLAAVPSAAASEIRVVASTPDLGALAQVVGGERADVTSLARGTEDPHFVDPRPSMIVALNRADVLVEGGAELEIGWLPRVAESARNSAIQPGAPGRVLANEGLRLLEIPTKAIDRSLGDVHPAGNPHYLLDPRIGVQVAHTLARHFAAVDPEGAEVYRANADAFAARMDERMADWKRRLASLEGQDVMAYHKSFEYLADWLGFRIVLYAEPKPGIPPNPSHVAELVERTRERPGMLMIASTHNPRSIAEQVAETGAHLVVLPAMVGAEEGTGTYEDMLQQIVDRLAAALAAPASAGSEPRS